MPSSRIVLALCLLALPGACLADYWYCSFTLSQDPGTSYISNVFGPISDLVYGGKPSDTTSARMRTAFTKFLSQNFDARPGTPTCGHYIDENSAAASRSAYAKRVKDDGGKVVETEWTYSPGQ
jgi:hypothetical protein